MDKIPLTQVSLSKLEIGYAIDALTTGWISGTGSYVKRFEQRLAEILMVEHVIAVSNGTVALELALRALGIRPGDEVIVPALTFVAPAAAVRAVGALPIFADIDLETWTLDPEAVQRQITRRTQAIIAVDVLGHPCDYHRLLDVTGHIPVIEDAAEAHGAKYGSLPVGNFGMVATFSFHANKVITTGEGGCVATDNTKLAEHMRLIANHGMTPERPYWHEVVGTNYRMTNVTAGIGLGQVERWDVLVAARRHVGQLYDKRLETLYPIVQPRPVVSWATPTCWLYTAFSSQRDTILAALHEANIDARAIWPALVDLPLYRDSVRGEYPVARKVAHEAFWLPTWTGMPEETIHYVVDVLEKAVKIHA